MNKAYSNKALPSGTILREWRLEEVLGVGGFGIVYKGRGIYFDELVAIKEYFPSAISDRQEGDTVVPIDSEAEEVHALGLKKFVEEAKLLWNLSTPSRHPNIVSVRSLFEIHGTAYMVMDFEDGTSLSKLLKQGRRFNEASLIALIQPIAEGLERAHRVGVLHRDIKPPNILVNEDGRPVLIDFGSARFESAEATSTKVTFHTPPYAAIEQYVKTYPQGPWTDVYALGVVLYECVTGQKPPEVLERMHGGLGQELAEQEWPGYSRSFLKAVDAAMIIRPTDRPQSITDWLALFNEPDDGASTAADLDDDDATRFAAFDTLSRKIVPVAPPPPGFDRVENVDTPVPEDISEVRFKRAGEDTNARKKAEAAQLLPEAATPAEAEVPADTGPPEADDKPPPMEPLDRVAPVKPTAKPRPAQKSGGSKRPLLIAGAAIAVAVALVGGWYFARMVMPGSSTEADSPAGGAVVAGDTGAAAVAISGADGIAPAVQALAGDARQAGAPAAAVSPLAAAGTRLAELYSGLQASGQAGQGEAEMTALAKTATAQFANALLGDVERRAQRIARDLPWADPRRANAAQAESRERQGVATRLRQARSGLRAAALAAGNAADPGQAVTSGQQALAAWRGFASSQARAYATGASAEAAAVATAAAIATQEAALPSEAPAAATAGVSSSKQQQLAAIVATCRGMAADVIRLGKISRPKSAASDEEKENYRILQQNAKSAQGYLTYLNTLTNSMRGAKNDREADRLITQAEQTRYYLQVLQSRSTAASK